MYLLELFLTLLPYLFFFEKKTAQYGQKFGNNCWKTSYLWNEFVILVRDYTKAHCKFYKCSIKEKYKDFKMHAKSEGQKKKKHASAVPFKTHTLVFKHLSRRLLENIETLKKISRISVSNLLQATSGIS